MATHSCTMVNGLARKRSRSLPWSGAGKGWPLMNRNRPVSSGREAVASRHSQMPSRRGKCTSVTTASNGCWSTASNPSTPSSAVTTSQPCCSRAKRRVARTSSSSSTTRMRSLFASVIRGSPGGGAPRVGQTYATKCTNCTPWLYAICGPAARGASGDVGDAGAARGAEPLGQIPHPGRRAEAAFLVSGAEDLGDFAAQRQCLLRSEIPGQLAHEAYELTNVGGTADAVLGGKPPLELHAGRRSRRGAV